MISASDIWLAICHKFARKVLKDPQKYRNFFVNHDGKMSLVFNIDPYSQYWKGFPSQTNQWDKAIEYYFNKVSENVKQDIGAVMKNDFTNSNNIEQISAQMIFLSSMKEYFSYQMMIICGIQNIHFLGKIEDCERLDNKIQFLMNKFPLFEVKGILEIVNNFIFEMKNPNQIDINFWNNIFHQKKQDIYSFNGCGYEAKEKQIFDGWFKHFFEEQEEEEFNDQYYNLEWIQNNKANRIPSFCSKYQVEVQYLSVKYEQTFETGVKGIEEVHPNTFRPNIYIQIY
ncbi:hypothetical protein ABPG72_006685 [Tetrahymena utriculariae]